MSRLHFDSPSGGAELHGAERHWLCHLAAGPAAAAYDLDRVDLDRCRLVIGMIPEPPPGPYGANYLHDLLRRAEAADVRYHQRWVSVHDHEPHDHLPLRHLTSSLRLRVASVQACDTEFVVAGHTLGAYNVVLNTALACGADPIRMAAKLSGWDFCLIEAKDRRWLADVIDAGVNGGGLRGGLARDDGSDPWDLGWGAVTAFLRSSDTQPVVTHHSTGDSFPNPDVAGWEPPTLPADWRPTWANDAEGLAEWEAKSAEKKTEARDSFTADQWYEIPDEQQWSMALAGLRQSRPWCRLAPDTLGEIYFGPVVTAYDLLAPDRDERVTRAFAALAEGGES